MKIKQLILAVFAIGMSFGSVNGASFDMGEIIKDPLPETTEKGGGKLWELRDTEQYGSYPVEHLILRAVDTYTTLEDCKHEDSVKQIRNIFEKLGVSAHYIIGLDGKIFEFVETDKVAYHAGISSFGSSSQKWVSPKSGRETLNWTSLTIGLISDGFARGPQFEETRLDADRNWYVSGTFTEQQKESTAWLSSKLMSDYNIPKDHVLGHSDIGHAVLPTPGANFFWDYLAERGIGLPIPPAELEGEVMNVSEAQQALRTIGYVRTPDTGIPDEATVRVLLAFQQHFMPYKFQDVNYAKTVLENPQFLLDGKTFGALRSLAYYVEAKKVEHN